MGLNRATGINDDNLAQFSIHLQNKPDLRRYPTLPNTVIPGRDTPDRLRQDGLHIETALQHAPVFQRGRHVQHHPAACRRHQLQGADYRRLSWAFDLGKLSVMGGVRVEKQGRYGGALQCSAAERRAGRRSWVQTPAETRRRIQARRPAGYEGGRQPRVFPACAKYTPFRSLITRLSYAATLAGRRLDSSFPATINLPTTEFALGNSTSNPSLKPQRVDN